MRVPREFLECLVFVSATTFAYGQFDEPLTEPLLGPAVPLNTDLTLVETLRIAFMEPELGPIIPIGATSANDGESDCPSPLTFPKDEVQSLSGAEAMPNLHFGFAPIRVIGHPMVAPVIEPNPLAGSPIYPGPIHPDQIHFHLSVLASQLNGAGLSNDARRIQEFQQEFQRDHHQRLLIAHKESQLKLLQAEIASLKQSQQAVAIDPQISLRLRMIDLSQAGCDQLKSRLGSHHRSANGDVSLVHELDEGVSYDIGFLVGELCKTGNAKIVAEPSATVLNGRNARFISGGEFAVSAKVVASNQTQDPVSFRSFGTSILINPQVTDFTKMRLGVILECTQKPSNDSIHQTGSAIRTRRLETVADIASGRTVAIISQQSRDDDLREAQEELTCRLVLITPEIVQMPAPTPIASPPSPIPTRTLMYRPIVEAKAISDK